MKKTMPPATCIPSQQQAALFAETQKKIVSTIVDKLWDRSLRDRPTLQRELITQIDQSILNKTNWDTLFDIAFRQVNGLIGGYRYFVAEKAEVENDYPWAPASVEEGYQDYKTFCNKRSLGSVTPTEALNYFSSIHQAEAILKEKILEDIGSHIQKPKPESESFVQATTKEEWDRLQSTIVYDSKVKKSGP